MLEQVLDAFGVIPEYDLSIMKDRQTLFDVTANILDRIRTVLTKKNQMLYWCMATRAQLLLQRLPAFTCRFL